MIHQTSELKVVDRMSAVYFLYGRTCIAGSVLAEAGSLCSFWNNVFCTGQC